MPEVPRVLKRDTFRQAQPCAVQEASPASPLATAPQLDQARIIEHGERLAVVEVRCQCGHKIILHCLTSPSGK